MKKTAFLLVFLICVLGSVASKESKKKQDPYFSVTPGFGLTIPLGDYAPALELAYTPTAGISYNLDFSWGVLGFGIVSGCNIQPTSAEATYQANLLSIPAAATIRYTTNLDSRLFGFLEAAGGIAGNMVLYKETYPQRSNTTALKPFLGPSGGLGLYLTPRLSIAGDCRFITIWYDDTFYMGISPGIRTSFDF